MSRKERRSGLTSIEDCIEAMIQGLKEYTRKRRERLIAAANNSNGNIMTNSETTTKKSRKKKERKTTIWILQLKN